MKKFTRKSNNTISTRCLSNHTRKKKPCYSKKSRYSLNYQEHVNISNILIPPRCGTFDEKTEPSISQLANTYMILYILNISTITSSAFLLAVHGRFHASATRSSRRSFSTDKKERIREKKRDAEQQYVRTSIPFFFFFFLNTIPSKHSNRNTTSIPTNPPTLKKRALLNKMHVYVEGFAPIGPQVVFFFRQIISSKYTQTAT